MLDFRLFLTLIILTTLSTFGFTQARFKQTGNSSITVSGKSTMKDWAMTSKEMVCQATFDLNEDGSPSKLLALSLSLKSESLKSGHSGMDKNTYNTLNTGTYKSISFELQSATVQSNKIQCSGTLTVCGVNKQISFDVTYKKTNKGLQCTGAKGLKMSDFKIDAPTFLFGTIRTDDEIVISFSVELTSEK